MDKKRLEKFKGPFDEDQIIFWYHPGWKTDDGQMVPYGNALTPARSFQTRHEMTIGKLRGNIHEHAIPYLEVNYQRCFFIIPKEDYDTFFENPRVYALKKFITRLKVPGI